DQPRRGRAGGGGPVPAARCPHGLGAGRAGSAQGRLRAGGGGAGGRAGGWGGYALGGVRRAARVAPGGEPVAGRAAYLSCAPVPVVVDLSPAVAGGADLYDLVAGALDPTEDIHATGAYRRHLAATLTVRAVPTALARARETAGVPAGTPHRSRAWS